MNRSTMRAAAISWAITCGLLWGGTGVLVAAPAAAAPGSVGDNHGGHGDTGRPGGSTTAGPGRGGPRRPGAGGKDAARADGNDGAVVDSAQPRRTGTVRPRVAGDEPALPGSGALGADLTVEEPVLPGWPWPLPPWPWPPCHHPPGNGGPSDGVGLPRSPALGVAPPPVAAGGGGGGSGGGIGILPRTVPPPGEPGEPGEPGVVSADRGGVTPGGLEPAPITMPPLIGLPPVLEAPLRPAVPSGGAGPAEPGPRGAGRESSTTRERPPQTSSGAGTEVPPSTRVGYPEYLRQAKTGEVAALALPGFAGLLALTALGGFFGYRQAKAGHVVRAAGTSRFLQ